MAIRRFARFMIAGCFGVLTGLVTAASAYGATQIVTTAADQHNDPRNPAGSCDINNPFDPTQPVLCSLRAAIEVLDATPGATPKSPHEIDVQGPITIVLDATLGPLPHIIQPTIVQTQWTSPATIDGGALAAGSDGLVFDAGNNKITLLTVIGFDGAAIRLQGGSDSTIGSTYLGVDNNGNAAGNGYGVLIVGSSKNRIGMAGRPNVISGNSKAGIAICEVATCMGGVSTTSHSTFNEVKYNFIGTDAGGTTIIQNGQIGVLIDAAADNIVGGNTAQEKNVISGNALGGIKISGGASRNKVYGNYIGPSISGFGNLGNNFFGVDIENAPTNYIGAPSTGTPAPSVAGPSMTIAASPAPLPTTTSRPPSTPAPLPTTTSLPTPAPICGASNVTSGQAPGNLIAFNNGPGVQIADAQSKNNHVEGNFIGTDPGGTIEHGNFDGIVVKDAPANFIGGFVQGAGNLVSGNHVGGVTIRGANASSNTLMCNWIGVNSTGLKALGNYQIGLLIDGAPKSIIGDSSGPPRNVIAGNGFGVSGKTYSGVRIQGQTATFNHVEGNFIGVDATGAAPLGNAGDGVSIVGVSDNVIGGVNDPTGTRRNVISANGLQGVYMDSASSRNHIEGNYIGPDINGARLFAASGGGSPQIVGVYIEGSDNYVGAGNQQTRNIISANGQDGVRISGNAASGNHVEGNYIGADRSGAIPLGNGNAGVGITDAGGNFIGGPTQTPGTGLGNVISGNWAINKVGAIQIEGAAAVGNKIQGNLIGIAQDGVTSMENGHDGIFITKNASDNFIGGSKKEEGNVIAFNQQTGVNIDQGTGSGNSTGNAILSNRIFSNTKLGIDLGNTTFPSTSGAGAGPNNYQPFPTIFFDKNGANVVGTIDNLAANTSYIIQLFSSKLGHVSGYGQGEHYLGMVDPTGPLTFTGTPTLKTNAKGFAKFVVSMASIPSGEVVSATATDPDNNTSEFAKLSCQGPPDPSLQILASWMNPSTHTAVDNTGTITKPIIPVSYAAGSIVLHVEVVKNNPLPDDDLSKAYVGVTVQDLAHPTMPGIVYSQANQPLINGAADLQISLDNIMKSIAAEENKSFILPTVEVCYRGRTQVTQPKDIANVIHIMRQKIIVFLPGVLGSKLNWYIPNPVQFLIKYGISTATGIPSPIAGWLTPKDYDVYPALGYNPANRLLTEAILRMNPDGSARHTPDQLQLLDSYLTHKVYQINGPFKNAIANLPNITLDGASTREPYYYLHPWPYDWRLKLENDLQSLRNGNGNQGIGEPIGPLYATPPSIDQISAAYKLPFGDGKVALAGHSTGGLIARAALSGSNGAFFKDKVSNAFFIDTPFRGAPKSYYVYLTGDMVAPLIRPAVMQDLSVDMPIVYYLAPTAAYKDPHASPLTVSGKRMSMRDVVAVYASNGKVVRSKRRSPAALYMNTVIANYTGKSSTWNKTLAQDADQFHAILAQAPPAIGWTNTLVFWSQGMKPVPAPSPPATPPTPTPNTPGAVQVIAQGQAASAPTIGDQTVPKSSQLADAPKYTWQDEHIDPTLPHDQAANDQFVWDEIIGKLGIPEEKRFDPNFYSPVPPSPFNDGGVCTPDNEAFGELKMDQHAQKDFTYDTVMAAAPSPAPSTPPIAQGFDGVYCDGNYIPELVGTGYACDGTLVVGEAKGGYAGRSLDGLMNFSYRYRQGTVEWARRSAEFVLASASPKAATKQPGAQMFLDALRTGGVAAPRIMAIPAVRIEVFHAECRRPGSPKLTKSLRTKVYRPDSYQP